MFVCSITRHKYLHESSIPTMHFQDSLPHLKVPKLDDTVERYLRAQKVILTDEEYKKTEALAKEFQTGSQGQGDPCNSICDDFCITPISIIQLCT